ncbi:hypothetical protein AXF42_Ash004271 [Apostasia shenzhenica]|uniref:Uncharacterized protein n=1 Tax=Apostasia shenzhenica TaxID=1088818 RepID=A0A2I0A2F9_9ASPA|nr:hypothetical protein AXF42_Ash004271 [Apostasia shenzhenica]
MPNQKAPHVLGPSCMAHVAPSDWVPNGAPSELNNFSINIGFISLEAKNSDAIQSKKNQLGLFF